jgi:hypothetical protein
MMLLLLLMLMLSVGGKNEKLYCCHKVCYHVLFVSCCFFACLSCIVYIVSMEDVGGKYSEGRQSPHRLIDLITLSKLYINCG